MYIFFIYVVLLYTAILNILILFKFQAYFKSSEVITISYVSFVDVFL